MNTIKPSIPDLSKVKLIDPATYGGAGSSELPKRRKKKLPKPQPPHPANHLLVHLQDCVDMVLGEVFRISWKAGNPARLTIDEGRKVLTAALYILDTDKAPDLLAKYDEEED